MINECKCLDCKNACRHTPGWFLPSEAEKAAAFLGLTFKDFFDKYLGVNWWENDDKTPNDIFVLAPALVGEEPGCEYPGNPKGICTFFNLETDLCDIHPVKPFECADSNHDEGKTDRHWKIAEAWISHQDQIKELLGREPETSFYEGGGDFGFDWWY